MVADDNTPELYLSVAKAMGQLKLLYVHLVDHSSMGAPHPTDGLFARIKEAFGGSIILTGGQTADTAEAILKEHRADLVAFGRPMLANPNLVDKFRRGAPLNPVDFSTAYTPGPKGYIDYPAN